MQAVWTPPPSCTACTLNLPGVYCPLSPDSARAPRLCRMMSRVHPLRSRARVAEGCVLHPVPWSLPTCTPEGAPGGEPQHAQLGWLCWPG